MTTSQFISSGIVADCLYILQDTVAGPTVSGKSRRLLVGVWETALSK